MYARRGLLLTVVFFLFQKLELNSRQSTTRVRDANGIDAWIFEIEITRRASRVKKRQLVESTPNVLVLCTHKQRTVS